MMKLIIQVPCYNEAQTLEIALNHLPKHIDGIDEIEYLIINDGSRDDTVKVAKNWGVNYVVNFRMNRGLAKGFMAGLDACLRNGADIIVNTDADDQYCGDDIEKLVRPILEEKADIVIGERPIDDTEHFSPLKKKLQHFGSWTVRVASKSDIPDAPSGFRAYSRDAAMRLNVTNEYTYTLETIIQAGRTRMAMESVPIRTNPELRKSRLFSSMFGYVKRSMVTIVRSFMMYKPLRFFLGIGSVLFLCGALLGVRFLVYYATGTGNGHVQSLILASILMLMGFQTGVISLFAVMLVLMGVPALCLSTNTAVDEMGTLANAALLSGRNWGTGVLSNGGFYYRYGMALVWCIPFFLLKKGVQIYKAVSLINALLMSVTPVISYYIARRYLKIQKERSAALLAAASTMISSVMFQAIYLRGDVMLIVMNWVCILLILNTMYADTKKRKCQYTVLLSFAAVYAYASHSRGIVTVIAVTIAVVFLLLFKKEKDYRIPLLPFFASIVPFLILDKILARFFKYTIWGTGAAHATGIPIQSIRLLFTIKGIKSYIIMATGWLMNSFAPTLGLVCVGLIACVLVFCGIFRRSKINITPAECMLAVFGGLSYVGSFVLGTVFFLKNVKKNLYGSARIRIDRIVYDRYVCCAFGILCLLGLYVLIWRKDLFGIRSKIVSVLFYSIIFAAFAKITAPRLNNQSYVRKYMGMLGTFVKTDAKKLMFSGQVSHGVILFAGLMFAGFLLLLFLCYRKKEYQTCVMILMISMLLYGYNIQNITISENNARENRIHAAAEKIELLGDVYKEYPNVWVEQTAAPLKSYQVRLVNYHLMDHKYQSYKSVDNVFVIAKKLPSEEALQTSSYYLFADEDYSREGDIVYVKGNKLKEALEKQGVSLKSCAE